MQNSQFIDRKYINGGRNSSVFSAKDRETGELVALKVISRDFDKLPQISQFELQILNKVKGKCENLISIIGSYTYDIDEVVFVMPLLPLTLTSYLQANSTKISKGFNPYLLGSSDKSITKYRNDIDLTTLITILRGIVNGVKFLHGLDIIHRDLKPENILFRDSQSVCAVIADFGVSYQYPNNHGREPPSRKICDTFTSIYKPPEVIFRIEKYSFPADIWSLGMVMTMIFSEDCKPIIDNSQDCSEFVIVSKIFEVFGTPSGGLQYYQDSSTFKTLNLHETKGLPVQDIIPRGDPLVCKIFNGCMRFDPDERLSAAQILQMLSAQLEAAGS